MQTNKGLFEVTEIWPKDSCRHKLKPGIFLIDKSAKKTTHTCEEQIDELLLTKTKYKLCNHSFYYLVSTVGLFGL